MARNYDLSQQAMMDMLEARATASIDVETIRNYLYNGLEGWTTHNKVLQVMQDDPAFDKSRRNFMTRSERYKRALSMTNRLYELTQLHKWTPNEARIAVNLMDEPVPIVLHIVAFEPVFMSQASPLLIAKYGKLIANRGILGCYLQTELGHGSNVAQLETTATYIPETQEFDIHSPTLTSSKWWIGALGKTATHGVVQAQLILPGGQDVGPHLFFVPLRSLEDHSVLPGIKLGDIGPKALAGFGPTDNGFAVFDHVHIPRDNMLSRFAQVTTDGKYLKPLHTKLNYGGMLYIRANMVTTGGWIMAKAATISIRYATVRRQGNMSDGLECQTITYPSVHYRLLPILSHAYVFIQLGRSMTKAFKAMSSGLASGDTSLLAEMHATSSGLKVLTTTIGTQDLEVARRSMGGHGYSAFAGLGRIYADYLPSVTYEGENHVLDQQVVRAALKSYRNLFSTDSRSTALLPPSSSYLRLLLNQSDTPPLITDSSWLDPTVLVLLLEWRAALVVRDVVRHQANPDACVTQRVSKAATEAFVAVQVGQMIRELQFSDKEKQAITGLYRLYLLTTVECGLVDILSFGLIKSTLDDAGSLTRSLRTAITDLCLELLPNAIGLTDAFAFTDWELDSALGVRDGNVYEALWTRAQSEPLNESDIPSGYEEYIKPMLQRGQKLAAKL